MPIKKLLTLNQLATALALRLPHKPGYRKIRRAMDLGMPYAESPMGGGSDRKHYLFDLDACLAWWLPGLTTLPVDRSAINAALEVSQVPRRQKAS